ncbi:50S ribosomal protein L3 [Candidatus Phytoplasma pyri]|uniref:50S ribosomal protein L3 n=1 Tax=Candidatus Phytoplasma pyri TaxID=47566 RepID=UPI003982DFB5
MAKGILGRKIGMTQVFDKQGILIPITIVDVSDNVVLQQNSVEKNGYLSTQLGFSSKREKLSTKPALGHFNNAKTSPKRFVKEIRFLPCIKNELSELVLGTCLKTNLFQSGDIIDVIGISKGKGFSGSIKRHNQSEGPKSHGSRYHRRPGSMGPIKGKIKGKKLPGQMGHKTVTLQNLKINSIDHEQELFLIKGSIPGPKKGFVIIKTAIKKVIKENQNA